MSATGNADRGMTLLETLVVLAVLGFISAISVVQVEHALATFALREAEDQVGAQLRLARAEALRLGEPVSFAAYGDGRSYGYSGGPVRTLPAGVVMRTAEAGEVRFYPDGSASGGIVTLGNTRRGLALNVEPATGAIAKVQP